MEYEMGLISLIAIIMPHFGKIRNINIFQKIVCVIDIFIVI